MRTEGSSSSSILKSTALIGGSNLLIAVVRFGQMKIFAVLLGPAGLGITGLLQSVMLTASTVGGLGIAGSGVRQISEARASGERRATDIAVFTLRRLTLALGVATAVGLFALRKPIATWVFGSDTFAGAVGLLSLGVFGTIVSSSQLALLNGFRRVADLARVNVVGSLLGTLTSVLLVWRWGQAALAPAIVTGALAMLLCSWWYARFAGRPESTPSLTEAQGPSFALLRLGSAFLVAGLMMTATLLLAKVIVFNRLGMAAAGHFQAGWGIAVFYIDFILNAMGVDFYPHLTTHVHDRKAANQLVSEQTEVALLISGPLIVGMIVFAPVLIPLFYSHEFGGATGLVRWLLLGSVLKIISWPIGYLIMAHAWAAAFTVVEVVWASSYLGLLYLGTRYFGIDAAGYAFCGSYLIYGLTVYLVTRRSCGFEWSRRSARLIAVVLLCALVVQGLVLTTGTGGQVAGGIIAAVLGIYSLRMLSTFVDRETTNRLGFFARKLVSL